MIAENQNLRQENIREVSIEEANKLIRGIDNLYWACYQSGFYLPKIDSCCISAKYLLGVLNGTFVCPKREQIKAGQSIHKHCSKIDLYTELVSLQIGNLGFDISKLPDKQWIIDLLYWKKQNHHLFTFNLQPLHNEQNIPLPSDFLLNPNINLNLFPNSHGVLFRKTKEQKELEKVLAMKKRIEKKEKRLIMLEQEMEKIRRKKIELEEQI